MPFEIIFNEGPTAMVVFEWTLEKGKRWPKEGFEVRLCDLKSIEGTVPYQISIVLDTDEAPPETRAYLLKHCFGRP